MLVVYTVHDAVSFLQHCQMDCVVLCDHGSCHDVLTMHRGAARVLFLLWFRVSFISMRLIRRILSQSSCIRQSLFGDRPRSVLGHSTLWCSFYCSDNYLFLSVRLWRRSFIRWSSAATDSGSVLSFSYLRNSRSLI